MDISSILKEIREGQQATPTLLKRQPDSSQQKPVKHRGIYSCNSHHTDECPQLQEDNTPQAEPRQPYTYSQPQNSQNPRYQPPHNRQQYPPATNPPLNFDEAIRTVQRENQEMREAKKRTESQLNHLAKLLQKIANQSPVNPQAQAQPSAPTPLLSQPLPNPKGVGNAIKIFHLPPPPKPRKNGLHHLQQDKGKKIKDKPWKKAKGRTRKAKKPMIKPCHLKEKHRKGEMEDDKGSDQKKKKKKIDRSSTEEREKEKLAEAGSEKTTIKCSSFSGLMGKVKALKRILH
ncbi:hypothetical protein PIB30_095512 [Stylosanthes scabra]|uniref:Uncharacterized protein n=1 Tax=Stylosanthes scabra TaxID=79078 RepID=A0ABU6TV76_9FABA|nr:hypothetical protein [Stylosanthes scabra]